MTRAFARGLACVGALAGVTLFGAGLFACSSDDDSSNGVVGGDDGGSANDGTTSDGATGTGASDAGEDARPLGPPRVYVGSDDGKIRVYAFDTATYALTPVDTTTAGTNPSFLALDPAHRSLYAVDEGSSTVLSFSVDAATGKLTSLGAGVGSGGSGPAHVSVDRSGRFVLVANYGGGTVAAFPRAKDGTLGAAIMNRSFGGAALTHEIVTDPSNAFAFVPNKGLDAVALLRVADGGFTDAGLVPAGDGARHVDFSPDGRHAYVIDENASTVVAFAFDPASGALTNLGTVSSLPSGTSVANTGAEIQVLPGGAHLIVSNRGDDSLVVFDIGQDGKLTQKARVASGGTTPRQFQVDPTGRFLFVGNQGSKTVVTMKVDPQTGVPSAVGTPLTLPGAPEFVGLVYLDAP